jgi:hypothetical protein
MNASTQTTLMLDEEQTIYLKGLLETDLAETRVEVRRADEPEYRDELQHREDLIRRLLDKLRGSTPGSGSPS